MTTQHEAPAREPVADERERRGVDILDAALGRAREAYRHARPESARLDERARRVLPGGHTRAVLDVAPFPFRVATAEGATLTDVDGHRYVDFAGDYTTSLLGHTPAGVRDAVTAAIDGGVALGATHPREVELAELLCRRYRSVERVRFCNSGTEANLQAVGTALHHTGRTGVGVFAGSYHGGVLNFRESPSPLNVPHRWVVAPYDDLAGLDLLFADPDLGCVVVEAVQGSGGCIPASDRFLAELSRRCTEHGALLVLDEVMTSRLAPGGAQELYGLTPDLTTLGKHLGGGMPFGAFGGRADVMAALDPAAGGRLSLAGTFNNNVVSLAAAIVTLRDELDDARLVDVNERGDRLREALDEVLRRSDRPMWVTGRGSMLFVHAADRRWSELYFHAMLAHGHYLAPSGFVALSMAVTDAQADRLVTDTREWSVAALPGTDDDSRGER